jgi:Protein of unknown function DUF262
MPSKQKLEHSTPDPRQVEEAEKQLAEQQRVLEYDTKEFTIELLVQKFGEEAAGDDIFIPPYQRAFSWDEQRQSRFIESVLMGLPIPFLFFGDLEDGRLEVVDGSHRLRTCKYFLADKLTLVGCDRVDKLDGLRYSNLSKPQQRRFKNRTIRAVVLSKHATEVDRRDLFDRINTGSLIAKPSEVRRGSLPGAVTDLIGQLAGWELFKKLCPLSDAAVALRTREEMVTRFFVFSEKFEADLPRYKDRLREYMDDWLKDANKRAEADPKLTEQLRIRFEKVMEFVDKHFPHGFAKTPTAKFTPSVRFDAIAVGVDQALQKKPRLKPAKDPEVWLASEDFFELTTSNAANVRSKIVNRIAFVRDELLGA